MKTEKQVIEEWTTIPLTKLVRDEFRKLGKKGETWNKLIQRLIQEGARE